ncbi:23S rRNA (guanosine2251-2'-O)-methyltransferase [Mycoplasmopsis mustelae]|uniref:23S rRNA (Guanosine2251-2'-O)-methyltransferase n=1 Tax=Mycoplasmopsis mustelae TaxID=171289 RepID=A0A4R7UCG1_9BACT|nr:23S rRNA (guanosine(2251)-2'-O)-methyltransferase RlmB [Mycoplasmopsis mustelae]TDV24122.1 23S rRNA (guanosine2251-2'-O)-methyltransferase [Mycoplasmopsis mustelae]
MKELLLCGKNTVLDAYNNGIKFKKIYLSKVENKHFFKNLANIEIKDLNFLNQLTNQNHQGFIALIDEIICKDLNYLIKKQPKCVLILDHIQDPHNFGAIIRTANAAGIKDIIFAKEKSVDLNATVLKISSGGFVGMNFYKVNSLSASISRLKKNGYWAYATTLDANALPHTQIIYNTPTIIIVGNEGDGVTKSVLSVCDQSVYIKQFGSVQSLNVSVATGIILFDLMNKINAN